MLCLFSFSLREFDLFRFSLREFDLLGLD